MEPLATTTAGRVRGVHDEGAAAFLGVPFAAPPIGGRRFLAPQPPERWDGVRDALEYGPTAPQPDRGFTIIPEPVVPGDDYLNLNVFTPDVGDARLPVMVWIHGGGFTAGCNRSPWYRGTRFARDGVVVVSVNYRLGAEGFMAIEGAPHNRSVLDWLAALEWVQDNAAAFGGDPSKVTIAGQSAGGAACCTLLAVPRAAGLFRRAICMSGSVPQEVTFDDAIHGARKVADALGVRPSRDELLSVAADQLVKAQGEGSNWPHVDGDVLPALPLDAIRAGSSAEVDVMVGATAQEVVATVRGEVDEDKLRRRLGRLGLPPERIDAWRAARPDDPPARMLGQAITDTMFRVRGVRLAEAREGARGRTYAYEFRWLSAAVGQSFHCLDIPFAFDLLDGRGVEQSAGSNPPQELADEIHASWVGFITSGDPGWQAHDAQRRAMRIWDVPSRVEDDPLRCERTLWEGVV